MSIIRAGIVGSDNDEDVLELGPQVGDERLGARFLEWKTKFNTLSNQEGSPCIQHIKTHSSNDQHYPMMFETQVLTLWCPVIGIHTYIWRQVSGTQNGN